VKLKTQNSKLKTALLVTSYLLLVTMIGCDAFVRKFTRKPKEKDLPQEELILAPEEYKSAPVAREDLYSQYFLFWKSWQDELIESLQNNSHKRQVDCARQALSNLNNLKALLKENEQQKLDIYIAQLNELSGKIEKDTYGSNASTNLESAKRIKRKILRDFSYNKIKDFLL